MRVCVVGQGPSAEGKAAKIDACDFVVRFKDWVKHGAPKTGSKVDALAWYGEPITALTVPCEHWLTRSVKELQRHPRGMERLNTVANTASLNVVRIIPDRLTHQTHAYLGTFASTGFRAIAMAIEILKPAELLLIGFDAVDAGDQTDHDARGGPRPPCHDMRAEKAALAELDNKTWLGEPIKVNLTWMDRPCVP